MFVFKFVEDVLNYLVKNSYTIKTFCPLLIISQVFVRVNPYLFIYCIPITDATVLIIIVSDVIQPCINCSL